jgi:hypothetical protein
VATTWLRWSTRCRPRGRLGKLNRERGRLPKLNREQLGQVEAELARGAAANGYANDLWALQRVAELIERVTGVRYRPAHVPYILRQGLRCWKPSSLARWALSSWRSALVWRPFSARLWPALSSPRSIPDTTTHPRFRPKLEGIGYRFVVPVFFKTSGLQLELQQLFASPLAPLRVPVFPVALLLVRVMPPLSMSGDRRWGVIGGRATAGHFTAGRCHRGAHRSRPRVVTSGERGSVDLRRCTVDANLSGGRACDSPTAGLLMVRKC